MRKNNIYFNTEELEKYGKDMLSLINKSYSNLDKFPVVP